MKRWILLALILMGCATAPPIPDSPKWRDVMVYPMTDGGMYIDSNNASALRENIVDLKRHQDSLIKMLKER